MSAAWAAALWAFAGVAATLAALIGLNVLLLVLLRRGWPHRKPRP